MVLEKLKGVAEMFLNCLNELPEQYSGEATIILQDLIQKAMVKLSKGKVRTIIFEAVKESTLGSNNIPAIQGATQQQEQQLQQQQKQQQLSEQIPQTQIEEVVQPVQSFTVTPIQQNQELDNWVNAMLYEEPAEAPPSPLEADDTSNITVSMTTETVVTEARKPGRPRKQPGLSIVDNYSIAMLNDGTKLFVCGLCEKQFKDKSNIGRHLKAHVGERSFPCPFCQKKFTQKVHMQCHTRIHTGERPYTCPVCEKTFATRRSLDQHGLVHSQIKRFKCEACDRAFAFKQKLQMHMHIHTGQKPFTCQLCNKGFSRSEILKSHKCSAAQSPSKDALKKVIKMPVPSSPVEKDDSPTVDKKGIKSQQKKFVPTKGRPRKKIKIEKEDENVQPNLKKESPQKESEKTKEEVQTISIQTLDGSKQQAIMKPLRYLSDNPNEICFEIIAHNPNTQDVSDDQGITIIERSQEDIEEEQNQTETSLSIDDTNSTTIVHDISSLPASLQALVQAATSVTSSAISTMSSSETDVLAGSENDTVVQIITQPPEVPEEVSGVIELESQNIVVSTVEEIVEEKS